VTTVPEVNDALQVGEQLIPAGLLVTVPVEVPANVTVSVYDVGGGAAASDCAINPFPGSRRNNATDKIVIKRKKRGLFTMNLRCGFEEWREFWMSRETPRLFANAGPEARRFAVIRQLPECKSHSTFMM